MRDLAAIQNSNIEALARERWSTSYDLLRRIATGGATQQDARLYVEGLIATATGSVGGRG